MAWQVVVLCPPVVHCCCLQWWFLPSMRMGLGAHWPSPSTDFTQLYNWMVGPGSCGGAGARSSGEEGQYLHLYDVTTWVEFSMVLWGPANQAVLEEPEKWISRWSTAFLAFPPSCESRTSEEAAHLQPFPYVEGGQKPLLFETCFVCRPYRGATGLVVSERCQICLAVALAGSRGSEWGKVREGSLE